MRRRPRLLGAENRLGLIAPGHDADLLIVDGHPLEDIPLTERSDKRGSFSIRWTGCDA